MLRPIPLFNASFGFEKHQKRFNQEIYAGKYLAVTIVYFCYGHTRHLSKKRKNLPLNNHLLQPLKLCLYGGSVNQKSS